jgi:hypothetical protein
MFCIAAGIALVLPVPFFVARYTAYKMKREARRQQEEQRTKAKHFIAASEFPNRPLEQADVRRPESLKPIQEQLKKQATTMTQRPNTDLMNHLARSRQYGSFALPPPTAPTPVQSQEDILLAKHHDLVDKFLEIAERRVSVLDDYGDENLDALPEEIDKCLAKLAKREPSLDLSKWSKRDHPNSLASTYRSAGAILLSQNLKLKFEAYHESRKIVSGVAQDFSNFTGVAFEVYVANRLKEAGYESVVGTPATGDQGADLIAKRNGKTIAIQAKRWSSSVGNAAVQEIVGALRYYNADEGWVVTNSTFTTSARSLAQANSIRLIDGYDLRDPNAWALD